MNLHITTDIRVAVIKNRLARIINYNCTWGVYFAYISYDMNDQCRHALAV